jgi:tetratricopeptide (TPR) repeat protein
LADLGKYDDALVNYEKALAGDPTNVDIIVSKAKIYEKKARKASDENKQAEAEVNYQIAKNTVNHAIELFLRIEPTGRDSTVGARAFYNRACYISLLSRNAKERNAKKKEILEDLQKAIHSQPLLSELAVSDTDIDWLWKDPDFLSVIQSSASKAG